MITHIQSPPLPPQTVPAARRLAAIDIGSNSIHLIVVEARPGQRPHIIDREKEMVRLASGTLQTHYIPAGRMTAAVGVLNRFAELARALQADPILVTATSAVREAWNRGAFIAKVKRETGLNVEILPGVEEARLIALAVGEVTDFQDRQSLIVDIGGGSTEFILTSGKTPDLLLSVKLGAVRLHEQFLSKSKTDPPARTDIQAMATHIRVSLARTVREIKQAGGFSSVVATSGTALALAAVALQAHTDRIEDRTADYSPFSLKLTLEALEATNRQLQRLPVKERGRLPGLDSRRADIILPGGVLLETILRELGAVQLTTCDWSLREGIILNYLREHEPELLADSISASESSLSPDVRRLQNPEGVRAKSVLSVARRYDYEPLHSHHTAFLARRIFDQTRTLHDLGAVERELLEYAALLHDIGYHIAHNSHHKHAMYLIRHAELPGFHGDEVAVLANIARYHRGSTPKKKHEEFQKLDTRRKDVVRKLTALLRIADGLDRRHLGLVRDVEVKIRNKHVQLKAISETPCDLELWCTERNADMFKQVFDVSLEVVGTTTASMTAK